MKRGFLLRAEERKSGTKRRASRKPTGPSKVPSTAATVPRPGPEHPTGCAVDEEKLAYGNLTEEEKTLPSDYDRDHAKVAHKVVDHRTTEFQDNVIVVTAIPQPVPDGEIQSEWIAKGSTKAKVLNAPDYPARIPKPRRPDFYEVRSTPDMGQGVFAKWDIKRGDLIFTERPLIVAPRAIIPLSKAEVLNHYTPQQRQQITMFEFESILEKAIGRLSLEGQADYRALHNSHTGDGSGPLLGILRSNGYTLTNLYDGSDKSLRYGAVCKIGSRLNHSCIPNVAYYFKLASFSMHFFAIRDIKAGDQLFYSYCAAEGNLAQRKVELAPYGFVCNCPACANATPESDRLRNTFRSQTARFHKIVQNPSESVTEVVLEEAVRLEKVMVKEGLDGHSDFVGLLTAICLGYGSLGNLRESEEYGMLVESFLHHVQ